MANKRDGVKSRGESFATQPPTKIWQETPSDENPYIATSIHCYGYDLQELMQKRRFPDVFYLLFQGELPNKEQSHLLEQLMIALLNPGPRHPATRAAMNAGVGKTDLNHILPISLSVLGGNHWGAGTIEEAMLFFSEQKTNPVKNTVAQADTSQRPAEGDWFPFPGFGSYYGGIDHWAKQLAERLTTLPAAGESLRWGLELSRQMEPSGCGWLLPGVAAAALTDLGFQPRLGAGIFQLLCAPGLVAHGVEMYGKPITAMPFPSDEDYTIEE